MCYSGIIVEDEMSEKDLLIVNDNSVYLTAFSYLLVLYLNHYVSKRVAFYEGK